MWQEFKELATDPAFILLKKNSEKGVNTNIVTTSLTVNDPDVI